ncbi:hypothetical protein, partial [Methylobacterium mesophilicum]
WRLCEKRTPSWGCPAAWDSDGQAFCPPHPDRCKIARKLKEIGDVDRSIPGSEIFDRQSAIYGNIYLI